MKLDVIVGNPPYNNGMHLDFINRGHDFQTSFCSMIVPANWMYYNNNKKTQAETVTNSQLRDKISPYLKQIVFYPVVIDIFNIDLNGGVMYFLDDHKQHKHATLINKNSRYRSFNSIGSVKLTGTYTLINIANDILSTMGNYKKIDRPLLDHRYIVALQSQFVTIGNFYEMYLFTPMHLIDQTAESLGQWQVPIAQFDSINEARSFFSYIDQPLIKFMVYCVNTLYSRFSHDPAIWDLVPDPGAYDHIFTDEELYNKYSIPPQLQEDLGRMFKHRLNMPF